MQCIDSVVESFKDTLRFKKYSLNWTKQNSNICENRNTTRIKVNASCPDGCSSPVCWAIYNSNLDYVMYFVCESDDKVSSYKNLFCNECVCEKMKSKEKRIERTNWVCQPLQHISAFSSFCLLAGPRLSHPNQSHFLRPRQFWKYISLPKVSSYPLKSFGERKRNHTQNLNQILL